MSRKNNLTEIWNVYTNSIIKESAKPKNFGTKHGKGAVDSNSKQATEIQNKKSSDIENVDGFKPPLDVKKMSAKDRKTNLYDVAKFSSEKFDEKVAKTYKEGINNNMKSVFDKLFEEVMGDDELEELDALGIDTDEDDSGDLEGEGEGEVTLTLPKETAQMICDMLTAQLGGDETDELDDGEEGFEDNEMGFEDYEDGDTVGEATEISELPNSAGMKLTSKNNKVGGTIKVSSGKAEGKLKKVGNGEGKEVPSSAGHGLTSKNNKVGGTKTSTPGASFFA
jgi:hypothetical protein